MEIGIIEFVAALVGIVSGVIAVFAAIQNRNKDSVKKRHEKAVEEMSDSRNGIYAHNAKEDSTLMRHYVRRSFRRVRSNCDFSDCKKESNIHTKMLARYIRKSSGKNIVLFGDAGSGKSTAMRYLFYTLSGWQGNSRNVLVTLTRIGNSSKESPGIEMVVDRIRETLKTQGKGGKINLFLDSFDEAGFLYEGGMTAQDLLVELRNQFFIEGSFMKQVDNLILATRPGIFPDGAETVFNQFFSDRPVEVYELLPMGEKQILKSYRSLKYLKKANPDKYRDVFGTTAKRESVRRLRHYLEAEKRTLGKEDASFFSNPLLIRYAYLFVDDFQKGAAAEKKSMREMYDRLVDKIIKWEFHVWMSYETVKSLNEKEIDWQEYRKKAYSFLDGIVERMCDKVRQGNEAAVSELEMSVAADTDGTVAFKTESEKMQTGITGDELLEIRVDDYISQIQRPIRHLLVPLTSETGKERTYCFCHSSFFEFLAGKYLSGEKAEYQLRRDLLIRYHATELPSFYYQYLCINSALAAKIAKSLEDVHVLTVDVCRALEGTKAAICKEPQLQAMEVYRYLPLIGELACQGIQISSQEMEQIYNKGKLDLSSAQVNDLDVVGWIVDYDQIRELDIHGMENMEIGKGNVAYSVLARMTNLIWIDLRGTCGWRTALSKLGETQLRTLTLDVSVKTEKDCDALSEVQAKIIRVELPEYSPLYQCLNSVSEHNSGITLYRRTSLDSALEKYQKDSVKNELPMLNAVYEMESRCLKFGESGSDATLWNGLSVVKCLADIDYMDESGREKELLERLTQYFRDRNDNLGMHF